nr:hypothetical protein Iba_scaffold1881CG0100 [Ipomoea batatas]
MHRKKRRKEPKFRRHWVTSCPVKYSENREPSLSPGRNGFNSTMIKDPFPCSSTGIVLTPIRPFSKNTHTDVAQCSTEHSAVAFYVKSPPTIFILVTVYVSKNLSAMFCRENCIKVTGDVHAHNLKRWKKEQGTSIFGRPVAITGLQG